MGNILDKRIKLAGIRHKLETKILGLKGATFYMLKRVGTTQSFITLASFEYASIDFDKYRYSATISFAVRQNTEFTRGDTTRTMRRVSEIADHIAIVKPDGDSIVYWIRSGDEFEPFYFDDTFKYFVKQIGDRFIPDDNE